MSLNNRKKDLTTISQSWTDLNFIKLIKSNTLSTCLAPLVTFSNMWIDKQRCSTQCVCSIWLKQKEIYRIQAVDRIRLQSCTSAQPSLSSSPPLISGFPWPHASPRRRWIKTVIPNRMYFFSNWPDALRSFRNCPQRVRRACRFISPLHSRCRT